MFIKFARFKNFVKHALLEVNFERGLVAIVGANGNGKSTITDGLYAALTNDFTRFGVNKADCIHDQAPERAESSIYIEAEHDGVEFTLLRSLRPIKAELVIGGEASLRKTDEIREALEVRLGIDKQVMSNYVFIPQWGMANFIAVTPSERSKLFQHLCNTQHAEKVWQACGELLKRYEPNFEADEGNTADLIGALDALKEMEEVFSEQLVEASNTCLSPKNLKKAEAAIKMYDAKTNAEASLATFVADYDKADAALGVSTKDVSEASTEYAKAQTVWEGVVSEVEDAQKSMQSWRLFDSQAAVRRELVDSLQVLNDEAENWVAAEYDPSDKSRAEADRDDLQGDSLELKSSLQQAEEIVGLFDREGVVVCPTCGAETDDEVFKLRLEENRDLIRILPAEIVTLDEKLVALKLKLREMSKYDRWLEGYEQRLAGAHRALAKSGVVKEPAGDKEQAQQILDSAEAAVELKAEKAEILAEATSSFKVIESKFSTLKDLIDSLQRDLKQNSVTEETYGKANRRIREHHDAELKAAVIRGEIASTRRQREDTKESLDLLKEQSGRNERLKVALEQLRHIRGVFHRDELPRIVAQGNLINMESDVNHYLGMFGNPFWVETDDNLGFIVHFPGEPAKRAEQLSGGQQAVLAMAFRCAINSLFKADIGMMVLDEPAAGLDSQNLEYLRSTLVHLASQVRNKRQIIVITHQDHLRSAFDALVEV